MKSSLVVFVFFVVATTTMILAECPLRQLNVNDVDGLSSLFPHKRFDKIEQRFGGISKSMLPLEENLSGFEERHFIRVQIVNGRLYARVSMLDKNIFRGRYQCALHQLYDLCEWHRERGVRLPDVEFVLTECDWFWAMDLKKPTCPDGTSSDCQYVLLSVTAPAAGGNKWLPLLVPGPELCADSEWQMPRRWLKEKMFLDSVPFSQKRPKAFWRGNPHSSTLNENSWNRLEKNGGMLPARGLLVEAAARHPDLFDAAFIKPLPLFLNNETKEWLGRKFLAKSYVSEEDFPLYSILVDVDGYAWSSRLPRLLRTNSLVVKLFTQFDQYFQDALLKLGTTALVWVEQERNMSTLVEQVARLVRDEHEVAKRVNRTHEFLLEHLSQEGIFHFWTHLLVRYANAQKYNVSRSDEIREFVPCARETTREACESHRDVFGVCAWLHKPLRHVRKRLGIYSVDTNDWHCAWSPVASARLLVGNSRGNHYLMEGSVRYRPDVRAHTANIRNYTHGQ